MRRLDLIIEGEEPVIVTKHQLTLNSTYKDYVDLGVDAFGGARNISFDFILDSNITSGSPIINIATNDDQPGTSNQFNVFFVSGRLRFDKKIGSTSYFVVSDSNSWTAGVVYKVSLNIDFVNGMEMYIDGVKQVDTNAENSPITNKPTLSYIGGNVEFDIRYFSGSLRRFAVWNSGRTALEVVEDLTREFTGLESGLKFVYPIIEETGNILNDLTGGYSGVINTTNVNGITYINNFIRGTYTEGSTGLPQEIKTFDLYESEKISVIRRNITAKDLSDRSTGTTNSFRLPTTSNNNNVLDFLELAGNTSQFPYKNNYVRYIEDGLEVIPKGRMNVNSINSEGYSINIAHGINDFFDLIRGKFLWEAYEPYRVTLETMEYQDTTLTNNTTVRDSEGYVVPLMDLGTVNPIPDYQQIVAYYLDFGLRKIAEHVGYEVDEIAVDLLDHVFTHEKAPTFDIVSNRKVSAGFLGLNSDPFTGGEVKIYEYTLINKSIINFDLMEFFTSTNTSASMNPVLEVRVNGSIVHSSLITPIGTTGTPVFYSDTFNSSPTYYEAGDLVEVYLTSADYAGTDSLNVQYALNVLFVSDFKVFHENILLDYSQTDFIKNILQLFNLGVDVDFINKKVSFYSNNELYSNNGNVLDLSKYFDKLISKEFQSEYGLNNLFTYKYLDGQNSFADGIIKANNINEDKKVLESELTASSNDTEINLNSVTTFLTTANAYDSTTVNAKTNTIGFRVNKVIRYPTSVSSPIDVDYIDKLGVVTNIDSDQSILTFDGLDWQTLINKNYSNLRDNVLNRFARFKVLMYVPAYIVRDFNFKDKIFIDALGHNFAVEEIRTLGDTTSEWTLIRINN